MTDPILQSHLAELGSPYQVFHRIESPALRQEAAQLIDFLQGEQIAIPPHVGDPPDAIPCLRAAARNAHPDRKCIAYLLSRFPEWYNAVAPESRNEFLRILPDLAPAVYDLADLGMKMVVEVASANPRAMRAIAAYAVPEFSSAEAVRAMARIAHGAVERNRVDLLDALVAAFPVEKMDEGKDAERLLDAIASAAGAAGDAWPRAMETAVALTKMNVSSAYGACSALPGILRKSAHPSEYLDAFYRIVSAAGLRSIGVCLNSLPVWFAKAGPEATKRFVNLACQAASEYGEVAGMAFLERKTPSSRQLLP